MNYGSSLKSKTVALVSSAMQAFFELHYEIRYISFLFYALSDLVVVVRLRKLAINNINLSEVPGDVIASSLLKPR